MITFLFTEENYNEDMDGYIETLEEMSREIDVEERNKLTQELTDSYVQFTGERPSNAQLSRLSDFILHDVLTDRHADKLTKEDYPVLSEHQLELRLKREIPLYNDELGSGEESLGYRKSYVDDNLIKTPITRHNLPGNFRDIDGDK